MVTDGSEAVPDSASRLAARRRLMTARFVTIATPNAVLKNVKHHQPSRT